MTEFSDIYKDGINCLCVPDYSMDELKSSRQHKKYIRQKRRESFVAAVIFIVLFSAAASATAYAAYAIRKNIQFTSRGLKIDFSNPEEQTDPDILVSYTDLYGAQASSQEDFADESFAQAQSDEIKSFNNWDDALKVIDFPITYPKNVPCSELNIAVYQTAAYKLVEASYIETGKVMLIEYTYYFNDKWGLDIDYNTQIIDNYVYTNQYAYDFWITLCQYGDVQETKVMAYVDNYTVQLSFHGYGEDEIYEVLEQLDLSVYE